MTSGPLRDFIPAGRLPVKSIHRILIAGATSASLLTVPRSAGCDLTFKQRVEAQRAIERVYYSHQIGATKPFEVGVPEEVIEKKVRNYLKQSAALERFWNTPVTPEALRAELQRIAGRTRMPERLLEIYSALDGDPVRIQECFVRPLLVERLSRSFFEGDVLAGRV